MAKIKYDVSDVEETGQDFDTPIPVGVYKAKITQINEQESQSSGNPMLAITYSIVGGEWKNRNLWDYIVLTESQDWKMRQFLDAVGEINGNKTKGEFDTDELLDAVIQVRVKHETSREYGTRAKVGSVSAVPSGAEDADEEEADTGESEEEEDYTMEDLNDMDRDEMEELIEEESLDVTFNKRTSDDKLRERLAEELGIEEEEEEEEEEVEDYTDMSVADLKAALAERGLSKAGPKPKLIKRLEKDDEAGDGDEPF